jgi:heat shock protein HslJ
VTGLVALTGDTPPGGVDTGGPVSAITAAFAEEGTISGFSGCREYIGLWESDPATRALAVTGVMTQGQDCTGQAATLETRYLRTLGAVGGFVVEGSTLDLKRSPTIDAETLVRFTSTGSEG